MHSWPIMVESMSARNRRLRRWRVGLDDDVDRAFAPTASREPRLHGPRVVGVLQQQIGRKVPCENGPFGLSSERAGGRIEQSIGDRRAIRRGATSVATRRLEVGIVEGGRLRREAIGAVLIAGPTASGKSALAIRLARALGGVVDQRGFDAGLPRPAGHHRAAERRGGGARSPPPVRPRRRRRELFGRALHGRRGSCPG